jgi:hypothetical protein
MMGGMRITTVASGFYRIVHVAFRLAAVPFACSLLCIYEMQGVMPFQPVYEMV